MLGINPNEFWKLTFGEFWPLFNSYLGKDKKQVKKKFSSSDLKKLNEVWTNGTTGRISTQPSS